MQPKKRRCRFIQQEDTLLIRLVQQFGPINWGFIAEQMKTKNARQCKDRWDNFLSPTIKVAEWTQDEDQLLLEKYNEHGKKWVVIAKFLPGRTDTQCKNRMQKLRRQVNMPTPAKFESLIQVPVPNAPV